MGTEELRRKIEELEEAKMEYYIAIERKMIEALRSGKPSESVFADFSGMKERYLEALRAYRLFGFTPKELYQKRNIWLWRPGENEVSGRVKTISMFLHRLQQAGLAYRRKEGRTFRYFITDNGITRLDYYKDRSKKIQRR